MRSMITSLLLLIVASPFLVAVPSVVFAQNGNSYRSGLIDLGGEVSSGSNLNADYHISSIISRIINWLLAIIGVVAVGAIIYAGVTLIVARGEESHMEKAKSILFWAVAGLAVAILAWAIIKVVIDQIL